MLVVLLAPSRAAADDGQGAFSAVNCAGAACRLTVAAPGMREDPVHPGTVHRVTAAHSSDPPREQLSDLLPANCVLSSLSGACLGTGRTGPRPTGDSPERRLSPENVALQAVSRLRLPSPGIRMSPDARTAQVVYVPTWMWIDRVDWRPVSKTVQVPGVEVTATATPQRVVWSMGDGGSVSCDGPGTPYLSRFAAASKSPDCGYLYPRSSAGESGDVFTVTAAVMWNVSWRGNGRAGRISGLRTIAQRSVRVTEVQGVVVAAPGGR